MKNLILFCIGGITYFLVEILYRGYSNIPSILMGAISFFVIGLINERFSWKTPLWLQCGIGSIIITSIELIIGLLFNQNLQYWNYSSVPLNYKGLICLPFSIAWIFCALICVVLDDYVRYKFFNEEKPRYKLF